METGKRCLIVVDYQKDFVDGSLGFEKAVTLDHGIAEKIRLYHSRGDDVMFTLDTHNDDYPTTQEGKNLPVPHCIKGTPGHALYGRVAEAVKPDDIVIEKPAFGSLELADLLRRLAPEEAELCGLVTDICVISNAVIAKAALPESRVTVDHSACSCADPEAHERALAVMRGVQIDVI